MTHPNRPAQVARGRKRPEKKKKRLKTGRLLLFFLILFLFVSLVAAGTTYGIVSAYLADVPEFNPAVMTAPPETSFIYDKDGVEVTKLLGEQNRIVVPLEKISPHLINAFIAIEDERFYEHRGFDLRGFMRSVYKQLRSRRFGAQGGSTITQQLAKNAFLTDEKTIKRKVQELYLAYKLETNFTKDEILEFYLNLIFFDFNAYGVEAAAQTYFGKSAADVTLAEAAMLAGIPNLPGRYSPYRNMEEAKNRQRLIISRMMDLGMISREEAQAAVKEELHLVGPPVRSYPYPHFIEYVIHYQVMNILAGIPGYEDSLYKGGLKIYTTLDQKIQRVAEETLNNEKLYPRNVTAEGKPIQPQAAVVVAEPKTGYVRAIVGGRNYSRENQDNRAVRSTRPAGSVLKPIIVYAPAFQEGLAVPGTVIDDAPGVWPNYFPENYSRRFQGLVTARYAVIHSLNLPAIRLLERLGISKGLEYAEKMGISTFVYPEPGRDRHDHGLSVVLGGLTVGLRVIDAVQAYAVLANQGVRTDLATVLKIEDRNGKVIYEHKPRAEAVLSPEAAYLITSVLQDVARIGTASRLRINRPVAAKTGTSNQSHDGWLAAYTPDYVAAFWIGYDYNDGEISRPWELSTQFLNPILIAAHEGLPVRDFPRPDSISQSIAICNKSGKRPGPYCPSENIVSDIFPHKLIPNETCDIHVELEICRDSGLLATEFCPPESVVKKVFLDRPEYIVTDERWKTGPIGRIPADAGQMPPKEHCNMHTAQTARPASPLNLTAHPGPEGSILLSWHTGDARTAAFLVYRKAPGEDTYKQLTPSPLYAYSLSDSVGEPGQYSYQVFAVSENGIKSLPAVVTVTAGNGPQPQAENNGNNNGRAKKKENGD